MPFGAARRGTFPEGARVPFPYIFRIPADVFLAMPVKNKNLLDFSKRFAGRANGI